MSVAAVVLAAGEGKRLRTATAKVLHEAGGRALIDHVLDALAPIHPSPLVVVVGHLREQVERHLGGRELLFALQDPPRGTGDAVGKALALLPRAGEVLVLSGDVPLIRAETIAALLDLRRQRAAGAALVSAVLADAAAYGRVVRAAGGDVLAIVEARDATPEQREIREVNAGTYVFDLAVLRPALAGVTPANAQGEYYLTDAVAAMVGHGVRVVALPLADPAEMAGVNSRAELAEVHRLLGARVIARLQDAGVTVLDPPTTWVDASCAVGRDTVLEAGVHLRGACLIGAGCRIGAHAVLEDVTLPDGAVVPPLAHRRGE